MGIRETDARTENQAWPDRVIADIAARQATMITHAQLLALGVRPSTIGAALSRGRLHPVHHGVHSLVLPAARPELAAEHAALLACGPWAVLSHETAGRLHGYDLPGGSGEVHVTLAKGVRGRSRPLIHAHQTHLLPRTEIVRVRGLPMTSVARTMIDLAPGRSDRAVELLVDQALKKTSRTKLTEALERHRGRPGTPIMRSFLDPRVRAATPGPAPRSICIGSFGAPGSRTPRPTRRSVATSST